MADGLTILPTDGSGLSHVGPFDALNSVFRYFAGRVNRALFVAREKGNLTTNTTVIATTVSGTLLAANTTRISAYFYNNSTSVTVYINQGSAAVATNIGIPPLTAYRDEDTTAAWNCLSSSTTASVSVMEFS